MLVPPTFLRSRFPGQCILLMFCHSLRSTVKKKIKNPTLDNFFSSSASLLPLSVFLTHTHFVSLSFMPVSALSQSHPNVSLSLPLNKTSTTGYLSEVVNNTLLMISHSNEATEGGWTGFSLLSPAMPFIDLSARCFCGALSSS